MFYVYVLHSEKDGLFYTGATGDLKARLHEHESGRVPATGYFVFTCSLVCGDPRTTVI